MRVKRPFKVSHNSSNVHGMKKEYYHYLKGPYFP